MKDLFGVEVSPLARRQIRRADKAHADAPGTGPQGETCGSCGHLVERQFSRSYYKCVLQRQLWTGGLGTDVRLKDRSCSKWITKKAQK